MLQKSTKVWSMASTERPVFRQLNLAPTNSLHTKTSSLSEWEAKGSCTGQNPSRLAALLCKSQTHAGYLSSSISS